MRAATDARVFSIRSGGRFPIQASASLSARILRFLRHQQAGAGYRVSVDRLCRHLDAPPGAVRDALNMLGVRGTLDFGHGRDFVLAAGPGHSVRAASGDGQFFLMQAILRACLKGFLPNDCSSADIALFLDVRKAVAGHAMQGLEELDLAQRHSDGDWTITGIGADLVLESYRFRLAIEPNCLLSPQKDTLALTGMKLQHQDALAHPGNWGRLLWLDKEFHRRVAALSDNRYMIEAVNRQIEIASLWEERGAEALQQQLEDHLDIIAALDKGEERLAAQRLTRHLEQELSGSVQFA